MKLDNYFGIHDQALRLRERRAEILGSNIANADTPGYKARDFDFQRLLQQEAGGADRLTRTHSLHLPTGDQLIAPTQVGYRIPEQPSLDGNTVNAEREQIEFAANSLQYQASLRFLNDKITNLIRAVKGE
jgi:flagellar basal-body rod protein FlgB